MKSLQQPHKNVRDVRRTHLRSYMHSRRARVSTPWDIENMVHGDGETEVQSHTLWSSIVNPSHKVYPQTIRELKKARPGQKWGSAALELCAREQDLVTSGEIDQGDSIRHTYKRLVLDVGQLSSDGNSLTPAVRNDKHTQAVIDALKLILDIAGGEQEHEKFSLMFMGIDAVISGPWLYRHKASGTPLYVRVHSGDSTIVASENTRVMTAFDYLLELSKAHKAAVNRGGS